MTVADKILFTCSACEYRARIPAHYAGRSIHCPGCKTIQAVSAIEEPGVPRAAPVAKLDTPTGGHAVLTTGSTSATPGASKIVFACNACSYKGRLAAEYDGKTIRCPGCQTAQAVKGTPAPTPIVASMAADETAFRGGESEKIRFACSACGYRARIPGKYADKPIHCPQCKQVQVAKAETDLEEATGRTVSISRVTPAAVKEPRLAMTNLGVQFHCAVCGFESRISPSCAGDAIYCPSCRAPQKVEWGDPADLAKAAGSAPLAAPAASAPVLEDLPLPAFDLEPTAPSPLATIPAPVTAVEPAKPAGEGTDLFAALPPVVEAKATATVIKKGSRRIVSVVGSGVAAAPAISEPAAPKAPISLAPPNAAVAMVAPRDVSAAPASASTRPRRLVKAEGSDASSSAHRSPPVDHPVTRVDVPASAPVHASQLPVIVLTVVVACLIAVSGVLFLQIRKLEGKQNELEQSAKAAQDQAAADARMAGEQLAAQKAAAEKAQQEAEAAKREVEAAKQAADAVRAELEALKAATLVPVDAVPAPMPAADPVPTPSETVEPPKP